MKLAILTDSSANFTKEFIQEHANLYVLPLMIIKGEESYRDQIEISTAEVYALLDDYKISTSLPSREDVEVTIQQIKQAGFTDVLIIPVSSGLSGTFNFLRLYLEEEKQLKVHLFDSKSLAGGQGLIVEHALELYQKGHTIETILQKINKTRFQNSLSFYTTQTLKYLKRGGRIGKVEATIGDVLHIRPIITVNDDGIFTTLSKAFGLPRALVQMYRLLQEKFGKRLIDLTIHFGTDYEKAKELAERLKSSLNIRRLNLTALTPVLGVHTGPSIIAYCAREIVD